MTTRLRLMALVLFGSLAVNLFLGGLMVGRWLEPHHPPGPPHCPRFEREDRGPGAPPFWLRRAIGPDGAETLDEIWQKHASAIAPLRDELQRSRRAVIDTLEAEPFDSRAYAAALADMQTRTSRLFEAIHGAMVDVVEHLTPEQRRQMVEQSREWQRRHDRSKDD
jgi:uncharacterized membrane protein